MEIVTFTNRLGEAVTFGGPPFYLSSITGLGETQAAIQSQKIPYQDGITVIDILLEERPIEIGFTILNDIGDNSYGSISRRREQLGHIINPKLGAGKIRYENEYVVREIEVIPESVPLFPDKGERARSIQKGSVSFVAPDPYWQSQQIDEEPAFKSLFKFPFSGLFRMGLQQFERIIYNDGDAPTPIVIEFKGPAENPFVRNNTTGEYIKVNQQLLEGEVMLVDTTDGNKKVIFIDSDGVERDMISWIDINSTFFKLQIGTNEITYGADNIVTSNIVDMRYRKKYNAV